MPHGYSGSIQVGGKWLSLGWRLGYRSAQLFKGCKYQTKQVHRLVAEAWIERAPTDGDWVNHKNGVKHDNRVVNLEWSTPAENNAHAYRTGLRVAASRRFCDEQVRSIRARIALGEQQRSIAQEFDVAESVISQLNSRKTYIHIL